MVKNSSRIRTYLNTLEAAAFGHTPARRGLTVFPDDIFLVSYFRSGNTWSRFLLGNLIHQDEPVTFANIERLVPSIYELPDRVLRSLPRVLTSHECAIARVLMQPCQIHWIMTR